MANAYNSGTKTFSIDTSTDVAGLTTLKGSAPDLSDYVCITGSAVLTIEQDASFRQLNVGYAAINGGSGGSYGATLRVLDGVTLTLLDNEKLYVHSTARFETQGTMRSVGTSDGQPDQAYTLPSADFTAIQVAGEWWRWVPSLTGWRVQCGTTNNSTTVNVASDPRITGLHFGATIEVRDTTTGALVGTRTITSMSATTITVNSAITTTSAHGVYLPIEATEKVYEVDGATLRFGDGTASAWDNKGGAIPPSGAAITRPGVLVKSSGTAGHIWEQVHGSVSFSGTMFVRQRRSTQGHAAHGATTFAFWTMANCAWDAAGTTDRALSTYRQRIALAMVLCMRSTDRGFYAQYSHGPVVAGLYAIANAQTAITFESCGYVDADGLYADGSAGGAGIFMSGAAGCLVRGVSVARTASSGISIASCADSWFSGNVEKTGYLWYPVVFQACVRSRGVFTVRQSLSASQRRAAVLYGRDSSMRVDSDTVLAGAPMPFSTYRSHIQERRTTGTGSVYLCSESFDDAAVIGYPADIYLVITTADAWATSHVMHVPGLQAWGSAVFSQVPNGATITWEYRRSTDYGATWTPWTTLTTAGISGTPDPYGECVQMRVKASNIGATYPRVEYVQLNFTPLPGWTEPASWKGVVDVAAALRPRTERWPR